MTTQYLEWRLRYCCSTWAHRAYYVPVLVSTLTGDVKEYGDATGRKRDAEREVARLEKRRLRVAL